MQTLNALYRHLLAEGRRKPDNDIRMFGYWKARRETGSDPRPDEIAKQCGDHDAAMWVLVATTGMRRSELAGAVRGLSDLDKRTFTKADTRVVVRGQG